jgi:dipeptidyl aminopeptidase/acylaminoacyl peptidase
MGQSYGSYCVLALIAQSHRFKAAVITAAVIHPDLIADYLQMQSDGATPSIEYWERGQGNIGGTPWQYPERYLRNSPIFAFDQIETPVLIGQGSRDGNLTASDSIFVGLRRLGKRVEYRIYENEDHVIERPENVIDFWQRRLEFLDQHLGVQRDRQGRMVFESAHVAPLNEFQGSAGE